MGLSRYYIIYLRKNHRQIDVEKSFGIKKRPVFNEILGKSIKYHSNLQFRQYILTMMAKFILNESLHCKNIKLYCNKDDNIHKSEALKR